VIVRLLMKRRSVRGKFADHGSSSWSESFGTPYGAPRSGLKFLCAPLTPVEFAAHPHDDSILPASVAPQFTRERSAAYTGEQDRQ
jgi:hypothetical protein